MKKSALSAIVVLFLVLVAAQSATAQEKYTLKNTYPPGQYEMLMNMEMDMTIDMSGTNIPMQQKQTQYVAIDAAEKNADGTQKVVMEFTRVVMDQKMSMGNLKYDSADPDADESPLKALGAMVGLKITTVLDEDGNPAKIEGADEFFDKLLNDPNYPKPVAEMLKKQMTDESLTKTLDIAREMMPKEPVAVGETWKTEGTSELPMLGQVKTNSENTLKDVKTENGRKIAVVSTKSVFHSDELNEMEAVPGVKVTWTKINVTADTTLLLDIESGLALSNTSDTEMAMETSISAAGRTMEQKISGKGKTTVTVTRQ